MGIIQGLDTIPKGVLEKPEFEAIFRAFLPGWSITGEYNFQPGVSTQRGAAQLQVLMQNGNHKWINDAIAELLTEPEFNQLLPGSTDLADSKTKRLAALVQFMSEASGPEALESGGARTGKFIAFSSLSDPHLLAWTLRLKNRFHWPIAYHG